MKLSFNKQKMLSVIVALALVFVAIGGNGSQAAKKAIKLDKSSVTIKKGKSITLKATTSKKKAKIKWSTSNKKVAPVTQKGKVTGKKPGKAIITAKIKGTSKKATCRVKVQKNNSASTSTPTIEPTETPDATPFPFAPITDEEKNAKKKIISMQSNYPEGASYESKERFEITVNGSENGTQYHATSYYYGGESFALTIWFMAFGKDNVVDIGEVDNFGQANVDALGYYFKRVTEPNPADIRIGNIVYYDPYGEGSDSCGVVIDRSDDGFALADASKRIIHWDKKISASVITACLVPIEGTDTPEPSDGLEAVDSGISLKVSANGEYSNWEGVSNVSQFKTASGDFCFAVDSDSSVKVVTVDRTGATSSVTLQKTHSLFGAVTVDANGNYYMVTGEQNTTSDTSVQTVFISKYDSTGKLIKTIGDNGSSSLAYYYDESFYTQMPFDGGNCDVAINGNYLAINYAREMYSGHQSNSVWMVDLSSFSTVKPEGFTNYNSHSFGQRAIPYGNGFSFLSWGDCYNRAFSVSTYLFGGNTYEGDLFHFWVREGAFTDFNMSDVNNTFAKIGNISDLGNGTISHVGLSAKSLSADAKTEKKQIFIQIFDPTANLSNSSSYVTSGERSGIAGRDGNEPTTDYGVVWLTNETGNISYVQAVADTSGNTIILFQKSDGVYAMKVDGTGKTVVSAKKISSGAKLNSCETPVYTNGKVYWAANSTSGNKVYIFSCSI